MSFIENIKEELEGKLKYEEGACGICHDVFEEICRQGGWAVSYERPDGIIAKIFDNKGNVISEGWDIVSASAILDAELNAGVIPTQFYEELKGALTSKDDIKRVSEIFGYGRVITPASIVLSEIRERSGRTVVKRNGIGVVAVSYSHDNNKIMESPMSYCPVCAVIIGASRVPDLAEKIKQELKDARNTGKIKYELVVENYYEVKDGKARITIKKGSEILADKVLGCCMVYGMVKAEIVAGFSSGKSAEQFKAYCNICPLKHCWTGKSVGALGNIVLHRLSERGVEVEITKDGYIVARIPGNGVIEGRGTLCSLSALTNMLLRSDAQKVLKPRRGSAPEHEL